MPLLIDTYNVLHVTGVLPPDLAGIEVDGLAKLIQSSRYRDEHATLVCDGKPPPNDSNVRGLVAKLGMITIRYAGTGRPADDLIAQLIHASTAPRRLIVVSSDHAIQKAAKKRRCKILTSEEFLQQIVDDVSPHAPRASHAPGATSSSSSAAGKSKPPGGMSEAQINRWIDVFDLDEETLALESRSRTNSRRKQDDSNEETAASSSDASTAPIESETPHVIRDLRPGQVVPEDLVEEAERLWQQENREERKR